MLRQFIAYSFSHQFHHTTIIIRQTLCFSSILLEPLQRNKLHRNAKHLPLARPMYKINKDNTGTCTLLLNYRQ